MLNLGYGVIHTHIIDVFLSKDSSKIDFKTLKMTVQQLYLSHTH